MPCLDPSVVATRKSVCSQHIFGVVIPNIKQPAVFAPLRFRRTDSLGHLNVHLIFLLNSNEIYFRVIQFPNIHIISTAQQFQINHILQHSSHAVR